MKLLKQLSLKEWLSTLIIASAAFLLLGTINDLWNNSLSDDTKKIIMKLESGKSLVDWMEERGDIDYVGKRKKNDDSDETCVVFAHYKNLLGQTVYKFLGEFKVSSEELLEDVGK